MLVYTLENSTPEWTLEQFEAMRRAYFKQRYTKNGLKLGSTLEAAVTLFSAEMHRSEGHEERARELVSEVVENLPGRTLLLEFERHMGEEPLPVVNWRKLLLPVLPEATPDESQRDKPSVAQELEKQPEQEITS